eukprot:8303388-Prorocentrum_lima.AAC.1
MQAPERWIALLDLSRRTVTRRCFAIVLALKRPPLDRETVSTAFHAVFQKDSLPATWQLPLDSNPASHAEEELRPRQR